MNPINSIKSLAASTVKATHRLGNKISDNSPVIMAGVAVVGVGATGYLTFRATKQIDMIMTDMEQCKIRNEVVNKKEYAIKLAIAAAPAVLAGAITVSTILGGYHVLNKRNGALSTALSYATKENSRLRGVLKSNELIEQAYPATDISVEEDEDGKQIVGFAQRDIDSLSAVWYDESSEYVVDDHEYNLNNLESMEREVTDYQMKHGRISVNKVREIMGVSSIAAGDDFGWNDTELVSFNIQTMVQRHTDVVGAVRVLLVTFSDPYYLH